MTTSSSPLTPPPQVLGWRERVDLPQWGISGLRVKLDTGAKTSAVHAVEVSESDPVTVDGRESVMLSFTLPLGRDGGSTRITAPLVAYRTIRDTRARAEKRPVVRTRLVCGAAIDADVELALTDRTGMLYRVILGRRALEGRAVVDPASSYLACHPTRVFKPEPSPHDLD